MCGICGYTRSDIYTPETIIETMKTALVHRGPDDHGTYVHPDVVLGHRRLSIIDLNGGRQPMTNEDQTVWVVGNHEIYNFMELRRKLEARGHRFASRSDTEVLVHLYEEYGMDMVHRLTGMFAFGIWDSKEKRLFLARDRYGQKPLYYAERKRQLIFASELKALILHPEVEKKISRDALSQYLAYEYVPAPLSIFEDVYKLDAGCTLAWKAGKSAVHRYWDYPICIPPFTGRLEDCCDEMLRLLDRAVHSQLVSDVPVGVFLSGGVDSGTIVAMMARHMSGQNIKTFSIGFHEKSFDETSYAREVADHFGTDHREEIVDAQRMLDVLPEVARQYDEPFSDASAIPMYILSSFTRKHVTVALGGDGGDELFAGYDPFPAHRIAGWFERFPRWVNEKIFRNLIRHLSPSDNNMSFEFRVNKFFRHLYEPPVLKNQLWLGTFDFERQKTLVIPEMIAQQDPFADLVSIEKGCETIPSITAIIYAYIRTYLQEDILTKVDRASMAHSLEARSPFLDHCFGEFMAAVPVDWKLKGLTTKYILKRAMKDLLPGNIVKRKKKGFGIPKAKWLRESLRDRLEQSFSRANVETQGIFQYDSVRNLMDDHFERRRDNQKELWTLLMFDLWFQEHMN